MAPVPQQLSHVVHALLLLLFWRADRAGAFEMVAFDSAIRRDIDCRAREYSTNSLSPLLPS